MFINQEYYFSTTENNFFPQTSNMDCFKYWVDEAFKEAFNAYTNDPGLFKDLEKMNKLCSDFSNSILRDKNILGTKTTILDKINYCDFMIGACFVSQELASEHFKDTVKLAIDNIIYTENNDPFFIFRSAEKIGVNIEKNILIKILEESIFDENIDIVTSYIICLRNFYHTVESRLM